MKKLSLLIMLVFALLSINAQNIEFNYNFDNPVVENIGEYQILIFPDAKQMAKVGEPSIPFYSVSLLLPANSEAENISYIFEDKVKLEGTYNLYPKQQVQPMSYNGEFNFTKNEAVYDSEFYPDVNQTDVTTQYMNGYSFAFAKFTPIEYNPSTGEVYLYQKVTVSIRYKNSTKNITNFLSSESEVINRVAKLAQNKEIINTYPVSKNTDGYEMLIITSSDYSDEFDNLVQFHLERGIRAEIVTLAEIESQMTGVDVPEMMRNYIIQEYQNNSIQYVLLGGDADVVPYRGMYCNVESSSTYTDDNIPADVYFSALDGTWNDDGDNNWGEPDEDDLLPEVAIGRIPFSNSSELETIISKITSYTNNPVTSTGELNNPLLAGEHLYDGPLTWGADYLDLLIGYQDENGYATNGINTEYTTMFARDNTWSGDGTSIINEINEGHSFVHHVGHASAGFMMGLYNTDITNSNFSSLNGTTHNYTLIYSHGCICGAFDENDCVSEKMVTIDNCAVGVFTNSRYGWFNEGQTEGPSQHLHREFVDALYNDLENHAGMAEVISKQETAPWVENPDEWEPGAQRWCFYDHNVLTDPALPIWTANPFDFSTIYDSDVPLGGDLNVSVSSTKSAMENYTCVVLQNGNFIGKGLTDAAGNTTIFIDPGLAALGEAHLYVSGYNVITEEYNITISESATAVLSLSEYTFSDDNNNEPDYAETLNIDFNIENYGQENATNVVVNLSSNDDNIIVSNGQDNIGTINALDFFESTGVLEIQTTEVEDQYSSVLNLSITSDQYSTNRTIPIVVNAPKITAGTIDISELTGDGDGVLEADETGQITFYFSNTGHATSPAISSELSTTENNITINTEFQTIGVVDVSENFEVTSSFEVGSTLQEGDIFDIDCFVDAGYYSLTITASVYIGSIVEDFETGDFTKFEWEFENNNWEISTLEAYEGYYSAVSSNIDDDETSTLKIEIDVLQDGEISFYKKVSSEENWDYLKFFIDGATIGEWSGEIDWSQEVFDISAGSHVLEWSYIKDGYLSSGSDCAWLDYVVFPSFGSTIITSDDILNNSDVEVSVYPSIFQDEINFEYKSSDETDFYIEIYNVSGQLVSKKENNSNEYSITFTNTSSWVKGVYLYKIQLKDKIFTGKIIKK